MSSSADALDLKQTIRQLGRILGAVIRDKEGEATFNTIEAIRQAAVKFHHDGDPASAKQLDTLLNALDGDQAIAVARAFSYFKHLVNIAEDLAAHRQIAQSAVPEPGQLGYTFAQLQQMPDALARIQQFFDSALISPVLTAHPTEVQRKSLLDTERSISALLARQALPLPAHEARRNEHMLYAAVTLLWQSRMLRYSKLTVTDEIDNALSYYRMSLLDALPELLQDMELELGARYMPEQGRLKLPGFFQMGSWIGGDRDGNPFVNAATLEQAIKQQAATVFNFYIQEIRALRGELSLTTRLVEVSPRIKKNGRGITRPIATPAG